MSTMNFCPECNNMLYPKEDKARKILLYACSTCDHTEEARNYCVHRNEVNHGDGDRTTVLRDVIKDPTLPRTKFVQCPRCGHKEAVILQKTAAKPEEFMTLYMVCCNENCQNWWKA